MLSALVRLTTVASHNPRFPHTEDQIAAEWSRLASTAKPGLVTRPLVVLAGYRTPALQPKRLAEAFTQLTGIDPTRLLWLCYPHLGDHTDITRVVSDRVRERFADEPVDAVAISMGGLIARAAAMGLVDRDGRSIPPLNMARLFTLATPHRGANMARVVRPDPAAHAMKPGSSFLRMLDAALVSAPYEMVCYARLRDRWVGTLNCAPPGREPIWTPGLMVGSHFTMSYDRRAIVDIARRLRGEEPWGQPGDLPRTELPGR